MAAHRQYLIRELEALQADVDAIESTLAEFDQNRPDSAAPARLREFEAQLADYQRRAEALTERARATRRR